MATYECVFVCMCVSICVCQSGGLSQLCERGSKSPCNYDLNSPDILPRLPRCVHVHVSVSVCVHVYVCVLKAFCLVGLKQLGAPR